MNTSQKTQISRFGGPNSHSCKFCSQIQIDPARCLSDGLCPPPLNFSREQVCKAVSNGCKLFRNEFQKACDYMSKKDELGVINWQRLEIQPFLDEGTAHLTFDWIHNDGTRLSDQALEDSMERSLFAAAGNNIDSPANSIV